MRPLFDRGASRKAPGRTGFSTALPLLSVNPKSSIVSGVPYLSTALQQGLTPRGRQPGAPGTCLRLPYGGFIMAGGCAENVQGSRVALYTTGLTTRVLLATLAGASAGFLFGYVRGQSMSAPMRAAPAI